MKHKFINRVISLLVALVCVMGVLPLSAFAATGLSSAPASITQKSSDYMKIGGKSVRYKAASSVINNIGLPYVFNEQVEVPGYGPTRALCAYQKGTLGPGANGQKWDFKEEVSNASLRVLLTYVYAHTYGSFTDAGNARGLEHWNEYWSNIWFMVSAVCFPRGCAGRSDQRECKATPTGVFDRARKRPVRGLGQRPNKRASISKRYRRSLLADYQKFPIAYVWA